MLTMIVVILGIISALIVSGLATALIGFAPILLVVVGLILLDITVFKKIFKKKDD